MLYRNFLKSANYRARQFCRYFGSRDNWRRFRIAAKRYETSALLVAWRAIQLWHCARFTPGEVLERDLANPKLRLDAHQDHISEAQLHTLQIRANSPHAGACRDKLLFNGYCRLANLPVPTQYGVLSKHGSRSTAGYPLASLANWHHFVSEELPSSVIIKPRDGNMGRDVHVLTVRDGSFNSAESIRNTTTRLRDLEATDSEWLIEERLYCHPEIEALSGTRAISSVRLFTVVRENGQADIMDGYFRIIASNSCTDNISKPDGSGLTGNIVAIPNLQTGIIETAWMPNEHGVGYHWITHHPGTGLPVQGFALPDWNSIRNIVGQAALAFLPLVTVGWDIALTQHGPVLIEGNERYQHLSFGENNRRLREALENASRPRPRDLPYAPAGLGAPAGVD